MNVSQTEFNDRFAKLDEQFIKLYIYMNQRFDKIERVLETKADKSDVNRLYNFCDSLEKRMEIHDHEMFIMSHQLGLLNRWTEKAAVKISLPFSQ